MVFVNLYLITIMNFTTTATSV